MGFFAQNANVLPSTSAAFLAAFRKPFHAFLHSVELAVLLQGESQSQVLNIKLLLGTAATFC